MSGPTRRVTVVMDVLPDRPDQEPVEVATRWALERGVVDEAAGERIVSITIEPISEEDAGA